MLSVAHEAAILGVTIPELLALARWVEMSDRVTPARKVEILRDEGLPWASHSSPLKAKKLGMKAHEVLAQHRRGFDWLKDGPRMPEPLPADILAEPFVPEGIPTDDEFDSCLLREHLRLAGRQLELEPIRTKFLLPAAGKWDKFARRWRAKHGVAELEAEAVRIMVEGEERHIKHEKLKGDIAVWRSRGTAAKEAMRKRHEERMLDLKEAFRREHEADARRAEMLAAG